MREKIGIGFFIAFMILFVTGLPALIGFGFYKLINQPITQVCVSENCTPAATIPDKIESPVPTRQWHILRIPQTVGIAPGKSGVTAENPYDTTLPMKLSNIPAVAGRMYGDNVTYSLQEIIDINKGKDIVVSFGDTWCGTCLGVIRTFGEFEANYGKVVTLVAIMENDPGRLKILIPKYSLNPDVIFVSNIDNLDDYHQVVLQGYMYRPIVIHIDPGGKVDRILISSFGSVENLKKFIGIDLQEVY